MKSLKKLVVLLGLVSPACFVESSEPDTVVVSSGDGVLTVTWTVDGTSNPSECAFQGADSIDIIVTTPSGAQMTEVSDACEAAATSIDLPPGTYDADAVLLDSAGHTITTAVDLGRFTIYGDDELVVDADFPEDSFY
jgi:hypothetical protein